MNKKLFQKFSEQNPQLPFSLQYNWWNEVVSEDWDVALIENQGEVSAIWPFTIRKKLGFVLLGTSDITPYTGPYIINPEGQKLPRKYSYEKKVLEKLIEQFPNYHAFEQNCHLQLKNHLPLIWKGWKQTTRYTYILNKLSDLKYVYSNFADNLRREIKKAEKEIKVEETDDISPIVELLRNSLELQRKEVKINSKAFFSFQEYIRKHSCGKLYLAKNFNNEIVAGLGIIWDNNYAYYLFGGANIEHKNSGAMSLLMWKAIQFSSTVVDSFNFEGSMIEGVERFLRGFGGELCPYSHISHYNSTFLKLLKTIR